MPCTFDKEGNLLKFESGGIWFNAEHYHEDRGDKSRDFPMGSLQSSCAEYEHRTGNRGTLALIEAERAAWMESGEREALLKEGLHHTDETGAPDPIMPANLTPGPNDKPLAKKAKSKKVSATKAVLATPVRKAPAKPKAKPVAKAPKRKR